MEVYYDGRFLSHNMYFIIHYYADLGGRSHAGIAVSNPNEGINVFLSSILCCTYR